MSALGGGKGNELTLQNNILKHLVADGWLQGKTEHYNRELALYPDDLLGFVQDTQPENWQKLCALYPTQPGQHSLEMVASQLNKTAPNAGNAIQAFCTAPAVGRYESVKALAA